MSRGPVLTPAVAWPQNILRFHVLFPQPMDGWRALDHVSLARVDGSLLDNVLVDMPDGLWSPDHRCLTVLFHPARVKRGLSARAELGPALIVGDSIKVVLGAGLLTQRGEPVGPVEFPIRVGPPVYGALDVRRWISSPGGVVLRGDAPIDHASACAHIRVLDAQRRLLATSVAVTDDGLAVSWDARCAVGLKVDRRLEDVCGNRIDAAFEVVRA